MALSFNFPENKSEFKLITNGLNSRCFSDEKFVYKFTYKIEEIDICEEVMNLQKNGKLKNVVSIIHVQRGELFSGEVFPENPEKYSLVIMEKLKPLDFSIFAKDELLSAKKYVFQEVSKAATELDSYSINHSDLLLHHVYHDKNNIKIIDLGNAHKRGGTTKYYLSDIKRALGI